MAEKNFFDQFDAAPAGVAPTPPAPPPVGGGNYFDQFDSGQPALDVPKAPTPIHDLMQTKVLPTLPEAVSTAREYGGQALDKIRQAAPSLYTSTYENPMLGAEQKAVPHPERYGEPLSTDLQVSDSGEVSFRDKEGNIVPADNAKHVMLVGPDGQRAIYARGDQTEAPVFGGSRVLSMGMGSNAPTTMAKLPGAVKPGIEPTLEKLKTASTSVMNDPAILARPVPLTAVRDAFNEIAPQIRNFDPRVQQEIANELRDLSRGTVQDLNHASERLGELAKQTVGPVGNQTGTPTAAAAQIVKKQIDKVRDAVAPEMRDADLNYAAMRATQTITGRENLATVKARGNEGAFAQKMSDQATQLLSNPKYLRGFTPDEIEQLRAISEKKASGETLRTAAKWLSGKIATVGAAGAGLFGYQSGDIGGAVGGAIATMAIDPMVSNIVGRFGNKATAEQVNALTAAIRNRSPLAQQLRDNAAAWEQAWRDIRSAPSSMTLTALARSSRELSNAMRAAGVNIHPAQLMRGVEGPGTGQAGDNQQ